MYRDDDAARIERANALIDEIGKLEREKVAHAATDQRLEAARHELRALQANAQSRPVGLGTHLLVFAATAGVSFTAYTLLLAG